MRNKTGLPPEMTYAIHRRRAEEFLDDDLVQVEISQAPKKRTGTGHRK
jgi:hypothetical protein